MKLSEAIDQLRRDVPRIKRRLTESNGEDYTRWLPEDIEAVEAVLAALTWHPASEPPDDERWVLVECCTIPGGVTYYCDGYFQHGRCALPATRWRELPEANEPPETVFTVPLPGRNE